MQRGRPFAPGQSGNPAGRPKGAKNRLTDCFLSALSEDFATYGADAIAELRRSDVATYLKLIAVILPKDLIAQREQEPSIDWDNITMDEFEKILKEIQRIRFLKMVASTAETG